MPRRLLRAFLPVLVLLAAPPCLGAEATPKLMEVLAGGGFGAEEIERLRRGELVQVSAEGTSERELAIRLALLVEAPAARLREVLLAAGDYEYDPGVIAFARIRGAGSPMELARLRLEPQPQAMTRAFLNAAPGHELNLSFEEIAAFRALSRTGAGSRAAVERRLRELLLARYRAYRTKGIDGIAPYARSRTEAYNPGAGLWRKTYMHEQLEKHAPGFHRALTEYPRARPQGLEETFFWVNFRIEDKPSTALVHRMFLLQGDVQVFSQRYFYVSRHYNSVQTTGGAFPVERGSVLLVEHRVSTDRVAGFGMTERQQLETQLLAGEFTAQLERFRRGEATSAGSE